MCNGNGAVIKINLVGRGLDGSISTVIGEIHELEVLNLSGNNLNGDIPRELLKLLFMDYVNLSDNNFSGDVLWLCDAPFDVVLDVAEEEINQTGSDITSNSYMHIGSAVAISGNGDYFCVGGNARLYLYEFKDGDWSLAHDFSSFIDRSLFTQSLSMSPDANHIVAGVPWSANSKGAVYVFQKNDSVWNQKGATLYGDNKEDEFGNSVDITADGGWIVVGMLVNIGTVGPEEFYTKVFEWSLESWTMKTKLASDDSSRLGYSVAIASDGGRLAVGDPSADYNNRRNSGSVYVYQLPSFAILQRIDGENNVDFFGSRVSLSSDGSTLVVTATYEDVRLFRFDASENVYKDIGEAIKTTTFGWSVSLNADGSRLAVAINPGQSGSGVDVVKIYHVGKESWKMIGAIKEGQLDQDYSLFYSVDLADDDNKVVIGAQGPSESSWTSHVRV